MNLGKPAAIALSIAFSLIVVIAPAINSQTKINELNGTPLEWSDDINLSNSSLRDIWPCIAINIDASHIIWRSNTTDILYKHSFDGGTSWSSTNTLFHSIAASYHPDIAVSGQKIHAVWSNYESTWQEITYRNSTDGGNIWNPIKKMVTPVGYNAATPHIFANNSNVHIIWYDTRDGPDGEIYYRRSLDGGSNWDNGQGVDADRRITFSSAAISGIQMAGNDSNISVIWADERDGNWQIYWMISKDNGYTWEDGLGNPNMTRKISNSVDSAQSQAIAVEGSKIHIVWSEEQWPGPVDRIFYRDSTDNGVTWNPIQLLCGPNSGCGGESIDVHDDNVWVMWGDNRDGATEIHFRNSTDGGISWGNDTRLTELDGFVSSEPKIALSGNIVHVTWVDERDGNQEIYYKRSPDFSPQPSIKIPVVAGWNLISSPFNIIPSSLPSALLDKDGDTFWDRIQWYDPLDGANHWKQYNVGWNSTLNDLSGFDFTKGIWLNVTNVGDGYLNISGEISTSTSIPLHVGWNMVGYPTLNDTLTVAEAFWGTGATMVEVFDVNTTYRTTVVGPTYRMRPGEGYWVYVPADTVWIVDW